MLSKFHKWYDGLSEPTRLFLLIALVMPGAALISLQNPGWGLVGVGYLLLLALSRMNYVEGGKSAKAKKA